MRERFRQRVCFVIVIIDYFARKRRSKRRVKKRRRRDPPFLLLLHLLPGIKKTEKSSTRPPISLIIALSRDARRAALFSFPTTIFTNSSTRGAKSRRTRSCCLPSAFDPPERETRERDGSSWKNREKTSVLEKRQPSIGFFFSLLLSAPHVEQSRE